MRLYFTDKETKVLDHTDFKGQSRYLNLESVIPEVFALPHISLKEMRKVGKNEVEIHSR